MTTTLSPSGTSLLWLLLLTAASLVLSTVLACAMPFAALAALAAAHLGRRDALALMLLAWIANQAVGFGLLGYPHDPKTLVWGVALGMAAVASVLGARAALGRLRAASAPLRLAAGYGAGFVAFKATVALWALVLGGIAITLDPGFLAVQFPREAAVLVALLAFYHALLAIGVPAPRQRLAAA